VSVCIYPKSLADNFDAQDNLFRRSEVILRVALSARLEYIVAQHDFLKILSLYGVGDEEEDNDPYYVMKARLMKKFCIDCVEWKRSSMNWSLVLNDVDAKRIADGLEYFKRAQKADNKQERLLLFEKAYKHDYYRAAVELAKNQDMDALLRKTYLLDAFQNGVLSATDILCDIKNKTLFHLSDEEIYSLLRQRGERRDPKGYYLLGKHYQAVGITDKAITSYSQSYPFYACTELLTLGVVDQDDHDLNHFFSFAFTAFLADVDIIKDTVFDEELALT